jgi:hypothetical protein
MRRDSRLRFVVAWLVFAGAAIVLPDAGGDGIPSGFHTWPLTLRPGSVVVQTLAPGARMPKTVSVTLSDVRGNPSLSFACERAPSAAAPADETAAQRIDGTSTWSSRRVTAECHDARRSRPDDVTRVVIRVAGNNPRDDARVDLRLTEGHVYDGILWLNGEPVSGDLVLDSTAPDERVWRLASAAFGSAPIAWLAMLAYVGLVAAVILRLAPAARVP